MVKKLLMALLPFLLVAGTAWGATNVTGAKCSYPISVTSGYSEYFDVGSTDPRPLDISFEPDAAGNGTTATIELYFCSRDADASSCSPYNYDSDADGLGDTNVLDGTTIEKSGLKGIAGFRYLRVDEGTAAGAGEEPEFTICREAN